MTTPNAINDLTNQEYRYGFVTDIDSDAAPRGLSETTVRLTGEAADVHAFNE